MAQHPNHILQLSNRKYRNWVKAGLGLKYVKEGLEPFCEDIVKQQHDEVINKIRKAKTCSMVNCPGCQKGRLPSHIAKVPAQQCPFRHNSCVCQYLKGKTVCQKNVCTTFKEEITKLHAPTPPAPFWRNTDPQLWCTDPWSVAKCFINAPGYAQKTCAKDIDCTGLLHLFINSKFIQTKIQCRITGHDVFSKVRQYRNSIFHSPTMELDDTDVSVYIDDMIAVLEDAKELHNRSEAKDAVVKLKEIKQKPFNITSDDETKIRQEALRILCEKENELVQTIASAMKSISSEKTSALLEIKAVTEETKSHAKRCCDSIEKATDQFESASTTKQKTCEELLDLKTKDSIGEINSKKMNVLKSIDDAACKSEQKLAKTIYSFNQANQASNIDHEVRIEQVENCVEDIRKEIGDMGTKLEALNEEIKKVKILKVWHEKQLTYIQQKRDFRKRLIELYQECVVKVSPLLLQPHRAGIPIDEIYITPLITIIPQNCRQGTSSNKEEAVSSYKQIFESNKRSAKLIYVLGEAGTGKSVFCQKMIQDWCRAHSEPLDDTSDNVKSLNHYEFLLYIALRCNNGEDEIESMIMNQYDDPVIKEILESDSNTCLILLDGLDEWTPNTAGKSMSQFQTNGLPKRNMKRKYTVITTTRPWKFRSLLLRPNEVDNTLCLKGFTDDSIRAFANKAVQELNRMFGSDKNPDRCIEAINKCKIVDLKNIPFVLHQMVCLWYDGKLEEASRCNVYCNMLSLIFDWAIQRDPEGAVLKPNQLCFEQNYDFVMPLQLAKSKTLDQFRSVLRITSELAFKTLFSESKEMTLSFEKHILAQIPIPDAILKYLISIGLLTEVLPVHFGASDRNASSYSFVHKSIHEFLASVFINDKINRKDDTLRSKDDILRDVFVECRTIKDILQNSVVLIMLSGFNPDFVPSISSLVYKIACENNDLTNMRESLHVLLPTMSERIIAFVSPYLNNAKLSTAKSVQKLICDCISEAQQNAIEPVAGKNVLADVICHDFDSTETNVLPALSWESVSSMTFFFNTFYQNSIVDELWRHIGCVGSNLLNLVLDFRYELDAEKLTCILKLLSKSAPTLKMFALRYTRLRYIEDVFPFLSNDNVAKRQFVTTVFKIIPELHTLQAIQLYGITLDYLDGIRLCDYLRTAVNLRQISLRQLSCETCDDGLFVRLSEQGNSEVLDIDFCSVQVVGFSARKLQTVSLVDIATYGQLTSSLECLKNAPQLQNLFVSVGDHYVEFLCKHRNVTRQFVMLLKTLPRLTTLILKRFGISGNIFQSPRKMMNLENIGIYNSVFYFDSWNKTLDSIMTLPKNVKFESAELNSECYNSKHLFQLYPRLNELCNFYLEHEYARFSTKASDLLEQTDNSEEAVSLTDDTGEEDMEEEEADSSGEVDYSEDDYYYSD